MGSWNGTCMISNLPINCGDDIKLVLIRKNYGFARLNASGGYVYTTDIFTPSFLPLSGKYNDYGMIENIEEDWNYTLIEGILKVMYGKTIKVDGDDKTDWNLYDFLEGIERNDLQYVGEPNDEELFSIDIAKKALEVYKGDGYTPKKTIKEYEDIANIDVAEKLRNIDASFVMIRSDIWYHIVDSYKGEFYDSRSVGYKNITAKEWCRQEFDDAIKNKQENKLFYGLSGRLLEPNLYGMIVREGEDKREDIFAQWSEHVIVSSFINATRKGWMPQAGAGSQSECWEEYKILAEKIIEISEEKIEEYE